MLRVLHEHMIHILCIHTFTTRKQGDSDGRNRQKFVGIDRFRRISDEPVRRYRFVGKKKFVGISSELPTTFWRIPRNVILTNFRRYYDADTRDQSSSEKLRTDGERSSDTSDVECSSVYSDALWASEITDKHCSSEYTDEPRSSDITDGQRSSEYTDEPRSSVYSDGNEFVGKFRRIYVRRYIPTTVVRR